MSSRHLGADVVYAYPTAEIAVMGAEGAAEVIFRKEIQSAEDKEKMRQQKIKEYKDQFANPYKSAERGYIDDVIDPRETRAKIAKALLFVKSKSEESPAKTRKYSTIGGEYGDKFNIRTCNILVYYQWE